ncbi:MAG: TolC family protein [Planctomycetes bacterium]|nr:TolC family protein [Planctomycetota bacterium]
MRRSSGIALPALLSAAGGCTAAWYHDDADREVSAILREFDRKALADRAATVVLPKPAAPEPAAPAPVDPGAGPAAEPLRLDLAQTLRIAVTSSRDYVTRKESLYQQGLGFSLTRFNYGPQFDSAVSYLWGDGEKALDTSSFGASLGMSQLLPTNGSIGLSTGLSRAMNRGDGGDIDDWSTSAGISFSQPLLRGAGYDQYREGLTQAERSMVYAVRDFELFRQDYVIRITRQFFDLVKQKRQLANSTEDIDSSRRDVQRAEALRKQGRGLESEVVRARRRLVESEQQFNDAQVNLERAIQQFLIQLGLDPTVRVELVEEDPPFEPVAFDPSSAVEVALQNRLDMKSRREQLEDAERGFRLARNDLLPDLGFSASYSSGGSGRGGPANAFPDTWTRSASLSLEIPLQTIDRRNSWRQAEIAIDQARRDWDEFLHQFRSDIEDQLRALTNTERQLELDEQSLAEEARSVRHQELLFRVGEASNRDLLEARQKLVQSKNAQIERRVDHLIQRLGVYRSLGILFIGADGRWSVGAPADAAGDGR